MIDEKAFMKISREEPGYRPKEERIHDYAPVEKDLSVEKIRQQASRCMDCGIPFCHGSGCPLGNNIPEFNRAVLLGNWKKALDVLLDTSPFPEFTSRICPALCEGSCVNGLNGNAVTVRQIERSIIEMGFQNGWVLPIIPKQKRKETISIVGSGPSGMAAAETLVREGFHVVVYEAARQIGGLMRYGIPDFKLDKKIIERRRNLMEQEGIEFKTGVVIGKDISPEYIIRNSDAMILACGARKPRNLQVPGRELKGIHFALDFLTQQNCINGKEVSSIDSDLIATNKRVVVIGGGDTGSDCIGTAIRQGALSVTQIEIMPKPPVLRSAKNPWPQWPILFKETSSHKEGCERRWSVNTLEAIGCDGVIKALRCTEVDWVPNATGQLTPVAKEGSEFILEADLVLLAMGFTGHNAENIVSSLGLQTDERGRIITDAFGESSMKGVYITGDMAKGPSLVVRAKSEGLKTAKNIIRIFS